MRWSTNSWQWCVANMIFWGLVTFGLAGGINLLAGPSHDCPAPVECEHPAPVKIELPPKPYVH